jgi:hypothetical protein
VQVRPNDALRPKERSDAGAGRKGAGPTHTLQSRSRRVEAVVMHTMWERK